MQKKTEMQDIFKFIERELRLPRKHGIGQEASWYNHTQNNRTRGVIYEKLRQVLENNSVLLNEDNTDFLEGKFLYFILKNKRLPLGFSFLEEQPSNLEIRLFHYFLDNSRSLSNKTYFGCSCDREFKLKQIDRFIEINKRIPTKCTEDRVEQYLSFWLYSHTSSEERKILRDKHNLVILTGTDSPKRSLTNILNMLSTTGLPPNDDDRKKLIDQIGGFSYNIKVGNINYLLFKEVLTLYKKLITTRRRQDSYNRILNFVEINKRLVRVSEDSKLYHLMMSFVYKKDPVILEVYNYYYADRKKTNLIKFLKEENTLPKEKNMSALLRGYIDNKDPYILDLMKELNLPLVL